jgi:hypothetical protein
MNRMLRLASLSNSLTQQKVTSFAQGSSRREYFAMTQRAITLRFAVPEALAVAFGIIILIGVVYFTHKYPVPTVQAEANHAATSSRGSAELANPDLRLWRVHLLLR